MEPPLLARGLATGLSRRDLELGSRKGIAVPCYEQKRGIGNGRVPEKALVKELSVSCYELTVSHRFIRSLSRCVKFDAKGGKSRSTFCKVIGTLFLTVT